MAAQQAEVDQLLGQEKELQLEAAAALQLKEKRKQVFKKQVSSDQTLNRWVADHNAGYIKQKMAPRSQASLWKNGKAKSGW